MGKLLFQDEVYEIIGCAIEVHRVLGSGFLEAVYREALEYEVKQQSVPFESEKRLAVLYKNVRLRKVYSADIICRGKILLEINAPDSLSGKEVSQIINYLKVSGYRNGLLINFGSHRRLEWRRVIV